MGYEGQKGNIIKCLLVCLLSNNVDAVRHGRRSNMIYCTRAWQNQGAGIAQLGERKTEDLEAPCSIHGPSIIQVYQCDILPFAR